MARGFGVVNGSAGSDIITVPFSAHATLRTYACWVYRTATSNGQRILNKQSGAFSEIVSWNSTTSKWTYFRNWTPSPGTWNFTGGSSTNTWYHFALTYDGGSASNDPIVCIDGVAQTTARTSTPSGTITTDAANYNLGNRGDGFANLDGRIAEFAIWDRILTDGEIGALCKGAQPSFFQRSLKCYAPLVRSTADLKNGVSTVTGTAVKPHPKAFGPSASFASELPPPLSVQVPALVMSGGPLGGVAFPREVHAPLVESGTVAEETHPGLDVPAAVPLDMASEITAPTAFLYALGPPALVQAGGPVLPALDRLVTLELVESASGVEATQPGRTLGLDVQAHASSLEAVAHFLFRLAPPPLVQAGGPLAAAMPWSILVEQLVEAHVAESALVESTIGASVLGTESALFAVDAMPLLLAPAALVQAGGPAAVALVRAMPAGLLAQASTLEEAVLRAVIGPTLLVCHFVVAQPGTLRRLTPAALLASSAALVARITRGIRPALLAQSSTLSAFDLAYQLGTARLLSGSSLRAVVVYGHARGPTRLLVLSLGSTRLVVTPDSKRLKVL